MKRPQNSDAMLVSEADLLNALHPIGTPCRYWPGAREGPWIASRTRSRFWVLSGHSVVVQVEGAAGCMASSHVDFTQVPAEAV